MIWKAIARDQIKLIWALRLLVGRVERTMAVLAGLASHANHVSSPPFPFTFTRTLALYTFWSCCHLLGFTHEQEDLSRSFWSSSSWLRSRWICRVRWRSNWRQVNVFIMCDRNFYKFCRQQAWYKVLVRSMGLAFLAAPANGIVWEPRAHGRREEARNHRAKPNSRMVGEIVQVASMQYTLLSFLYLLLLEYACTLCESSSTLLIQNRNWLCYC
jgi:hypothetical protein